MRPRYETQSDLLTEGSIADEIEMMWKIKVSKMPISYSLDFMGHDIFKKLACWIEVKSRPGMRWGQYSTIMLSLRKLLDAEALMKVSGCEAYFVVRDSQKETRYVALSEVVGKPELIEWGGRTLQTRDSADIEPIVSIPTDLFRPISDGYPKDATVYAQAV